MAARRCSMCAKNYSLSTLVCPSCGGKLWYSQSDSPDALKTLEAPEDVLEREIRERKAQERVHWRLGRMVEAYASSGRVLEGDELPLLEQLAAGDENLWDICKLLANPLCSLEVAARIFAPLDAPVDEPEVVSA